MNFNILELLNNEVLDEQEKYMAFRARIVEYCSRENKVLEIFRILKDIELELETCQKGIVQVNVDKATIERLLCIIRIELRIIKYKIRHPELIEDRTTDKFPIGEWTDNKIDLIELIYSISLVHSVEHGKVSIKSIKEGFEYIFGIDLGNIHDRLDEIVSRKGLRTSYLEKLINGMNKFLDKKDE